MEPVFDQARVPARGQRPRLERQARQCLDQFFAGKRGPDGSPVSPTLLHTQHNYDDIIDSEVADRIVLVYRELGTWGEPGADGGGVSWDVQFVLTSLQECARLKIPLQMAAGIVLIYARLCPPGAGLRRAH